MLPVRRFLTFYDTDDRLLSAIVHHDLSTVRYILETQRYRLLIDQSLHFHSHQSELNYPITLLAAACYYGSYEIVQILINHFHANINKQHLPSWQPPLHYAVLAKSHRIEIVQFLLRHGAYVDIQDRHGTTALMLAVLHSAADIVHLLIDQAGANVRIHNQYHLAALDFVKSDISIINVLIRNGAIVDSNNSNHRKLFQWLMINKHRRTLRLMFDAGFTPVKSILSTSMRSLKSLCRLSIRKQIPGSHFRQRIGTLPIKNRQLMKYILLDDV